MSVNFRKMKLSQDALDAIVLDHINCPNKDNLPSYPYTTRLGRTVECVPEFLFVGRGGFEYKYLLGQTYAAHNNENNFHPLTDLFFLANPDGSKGEPWTRNKDVMNYFIKVGVLHKMIFLTKGPDGKSGFEKLINIPPQVHYGPTIEEKIR